MSLRTKSDFVDILDKRKSRSKVLEVQ
ncbi:hypothetical protein LINPERHAP1_LOCUS5993 [Linum perenne]